MFSIQKRADDAYKNTRYRFVALADSHGSLNPFISENAFARPFLYSRSLLGQPICQTFNTEFNMLNNLYNEAKVYRTLYVESNKI